MWVRQPSGGSAGHREERKAKTVSSPDKLASSAMASTFRIPKRKSSEDRCTQMESPLSRLQDSHDQKMQWTRFSDSGRKAYGCRPVNGNLSSNRSRTSPGGSDVGSMRARLVLTDILKTELGREYLSRGRSRPKRASDSLCQDLWQDSGPWRTSTGGGRGPVHSVSSGSGGSDRRRPLIKDTTLLPTGRGVVEERTASEGHKRRKPPSRNEDSTTAENKEERGKDCCSLQERGKDCSSLQERGKDALLRRNGEGRRNGDVENDARERCTVGLSRGSVLQHSGKSAGEGGTPKRLAVELPGRTPSTSSASGSDPQTPPMQGDRDRRTPPKLPPSSRPKKPKLSTSEPIVLSSDDGEDEEGDSAPEPGPSLPQVRVVAPRLETQSERDPEETTDAQALAEEVIPGLGGDEVIPGLGGDEVIPGLVDEEPTDMPTVIQLAFAALYAGTLRVESHGDISISNDSITIPLKDSSGVVEVTVALVASELRRYGIWDGGVLEGKEGPTPSLLFLWVSEAQAQLLQAELSAIHPVQSPGLASPFLLLSLKENMEGLHGVLLDSFMEVLALHCGVRDLMQPITWSEGVTLIRSSAHHAHLLSLLGQEDAVPAPDPQEETDLHHSPAQQESPARSKPSYTLCHCRIGGSYSVSMAPRPSPPWSRYKHQGPPRRLILFPPPPTKGGITVTTEDLECLDSGEFLNDVIIDFYLKYLMLEKAPKAVVERSHVFSSFFYKQLTRKDNVSEETSVFSAQHRRHQRVRTWTRHVDIFSKDYLFVPVNQEAHWYLVVICFPGLLDPQSERWSRQNFQDTATRTKNWDRRITGHSVPECTQLGCERETVCKRPCILVMNSLKLSYHERVLKLLREYLQVEWEVRRKTPRDFTPEQMKGSHCRVPLQDNSSDCGLYLLQYVESFLQNPVVHFELPVFLDHWFPRRQIRSKRDEIREMVLRLHRKQQGCGR
ncbi:hypothetical protein SKAU_G00259020 [Synaphobranchus kaupii]|uniref:Ubiquitin-like protease family profile domain-containing protein n=1 Tax=Synaphobranchus kaupii TaxID=118154 RepID=A0A9Q1F4B3_SYNKA|nr:hypothetical protein SKAU_G00259020 [Synaphobranchus kaupii]